MKISKFPLKMFTTKMSTSLNSKTKIASASSSDDDNIEQHTTTEPATRLTGISSNVCSGNRSFSQQMTPSRNAPSTSNASQNSFIPNQNNVASNDSYDQLQKEFADMKAKIVNLQKDIERLTPQENYPKEFFYGDIDLLKIHARNPQKYALQIASSIFSRRELANGVFLDPTTPRKTAREPLDEAKIYILQRKCH